MEYFHPNGEQRSARPWWDVLEDEGQGGSPVHPLSRRPCGAAAAPQQAARRRSSTRRGSVSPPDGPTPVLGVSIPDLSRCRLPPCHPQSRRSSPRYLPASEPALPIYLGNFSRNEGGWSRHGSPRPRSRLPCPPCAATVAGVRSDRTETPQKSGRTPNFPTLLFRPHKRVAMEMC